MKARAQRIFSHINDAVDAVVLMNDIEPALDLSFFYATGIDLGLFEGCLAILWPQGDIQILSSKLEETSARHSQAEIKVFDKTAERNELIKTMLGGARKIGVNGAGLTYRDSNILRKLLPGTELVDVGRAVEAARIIKDEKELEKIREAARIASQVADEIPTFLKKEMQETEAAAEIVYRMQKAGASSPAFDTIAAFAKNSAEPHYSPSHEKLRAGEPALFDFGARFRMYCSDITRTFFLSQVSPKFRRMYEKVREAQQAALDTIRAGVASKEVDAAAREIIDSSEFRGRLIHSVGHGVGLSVHDGGKIAATSDLVLQENMIMTVEPGIYLPGEGGVRIEDDVRITSNGYELLTKAGKDLTIV